ncbi:MAG: TRZ/ATZ family hydrolase [Pseudohongiella sp.]|nr:TRZ/ATZ family hydrolase [Pseudohongiella sp.]MDO9519579.1 TRZ/ATZ family hydrolase [Pseudohongiella sp.]MDP2127413.1 TRZ/ATZ family hydrolase [Pseudohongiella sp.]
MSNPNAVDADLVIHASWIIPATEDNLVHRDACLAVADGKILGICSSHAADGHFRAGKTLHLDGQVLIPGLINTHGHAAMTLFRGIADDLPLQTWLEQHIWPLEAQFVSEDFVYQGTQLAIAEMIRSGTTCFADMYFFPEASARAATEAGMRVQLAAPVIDFPNPWSANADEGIFKTTQLHDAWRNSELVSTAFGPHAPYSVADGPLKRIAVLAEELDLPIHMHVHETALEVAQAVRDLGQRPIKRLYDLGLLSPRLICVHATQLNEQDIELLKESGAHVAHCPESNLKLASGFCPVDTLLTRGINVCLGTDGAASNNDLDMFSEMRSAALLAKAVSGDASALPAYRALRMATLDGARALGLDRMTGSLEPGKCADIVAVRLDELNTVPVHNPVSQLVYSTQASQVSHVWVNGKQLLNDGELTSINRRNLLEIARHWQDTLGTRYDTAKQ